MVQHMYKTEAKYDVKGRLSLSTCFLALGQLNQVSTSLWLFHYPDLVKRLIRDQFRYGNVVT